MSTFDSIDFFTDPSLVPDPYPYFDYLRSQNPVLRLPHHGVVAVTGYDEACEIYKDTDTFSNFVALGGPFPPLPFMPEGDDIGQQIERTAAVPDVRAHGHHGPARPHLGALGAEPAADPEPAEGERGVHVAPGRSPARRVPRLGECEFIAEYSKPFATLVIADLLGVPEEDHKEFRTRLGADRPGARVGALDHEAVAVNPLEWLDDKFCAYIEDRRREPARGRADLAGDREVPGRVDARGHRGGPLGHIPFRRGPGDHRQAAQRRRCRCSATGPTSSGSCARTAA